MLQSFLGVALMEAEEQDSSCSGDQGSADASGSKERNNRRWSPGQARTQPHVEGAHAHAITQDRKSLRRLCKVQVAGTPTSVSSGSSSGSGSLSSGRADSSQGGFSTGGGSSGKREVLAARATAQRERSAALHRNVALLDGVHCLSPHKVALLFKPSSTSSENDVLLCQYATQAFFDFALVRLLFELLMQNNGLFNHFI